jgi:hypothetical protein
MGQWKYWPRWIALGVFLGHTWPVFTWSGALFGVAAVFWLCVLYGFRKLNLPAITFAERGAFWYWFYPAHLAVLAACQYNQSLMQRVSVGAE